MVNNVEVLCRTKILLMVGHVAARKFFKHAVHVKCYISNL